MPPLPLADVQKRLKKERQVRLVRYIFNLKLYCEQLIYVLQAKELAARTVDLFGSDKEGKKETQALGNDQKEVVIIPYRTYVHEQRTDI